MNRQFPRMMAAHKNKFVEAVNFRRENAFREFEPSKPRTLIAGFMGLVAFPAFIYHVTQRTERDIQERENLPVLPKLRDVLSGPPRRP
jgi:hypothetical protein